MTLKAWVLSAYYRFQMINTDTKVLPQKWGVAGKESPDEVSLDEYRYAKKVAYSVNQVCGKTKWESKCLVRALTAQRLLAERNISSTLYLGCRLNDKQNMIAHAWLRCGKMYVTGGNGSAQGYAIVEKFESVGSCNE